MATTSLFEANSSTPVHASIRAARCGEVERNPTTRTAPTSPTATMCPTRTRPMNSMAPIVTERMAAVERSSIPMSRTVGAIQTRSGTNPRFQSPM